MLMTIGGDKYFVQGIFFKVAHDTYLGEKRGYMYGVSKPNLEYAGKGTSHDLKGASHYLRHSLENRIPFGERKGDFSSKE